MEAPQPVQQVIKVLGGQPRVCNKQREYPADKGSPTLDEDLDKDLNQLYTVTQKTN